MTSRQAGVLGHPISHSLSPVLHRAAYEALGLEWTYEAHDVREDDLPAFMARLTSDWAGLSLTMPLKIAAIELVDFVEPLARLVGAVNTVIVGGPAGSLQLVGANTDVHGIVAALGERDVATATSAVVLGGGATATSALAALGQLGVTRPVVAVRSRARAGALLRSATRMGLAPQLVDVENESVIDALVRADAAVSTIPADAGAAVGERLLAAASAPVGVLLDVVYEPIVTPLAGAWSALGGATVGGERMLLHQGAEQVRLMTGREAPLNAMSDALAGVLPTS